MELWPGPGRPAQHRSQRETENMKCKFDMQLYRKTPDKYFHCTGLLVRASDQGEVATRFELPQHPVSRKR